MKKTILLLITIYFLATKINATQKVLGEETIDPLRFSNFQVAYGYNLTNNIIDKKRYVHKKINSAGAYKLSIETNLYKYMNAGADLIMDYNLMKVTLGGQAVVIHTPSMGFNLFAKPFYPLLSNLSLFSRISGGINTSLGAPFNGLSPAEQAIYQHAEYNPNAPGIGSSLSFGIEYYPLSRFGFLLEGALSLRTHFYKKQKRRFIISGTSDSEAPAWPIIHTYGANIFAGLNIIF